VVEKLQQMAIFKTVQFLQGEDGGGAWSNSEWNGFNTNLLTKVV